MSTAFHPALEALRTADARWHAHRATGAHASRRGAAATEPRAGTTPDDGPLDAAACAHAHREIASWPGYTPTPLVHLPGLADALGLGTLHYKDEGPRFGLGSFKALGGAYGVLWVLRREIARRSQRPASYEAIRSGAHADTVAPITVVTATDGNHGRSVAWGAQRFGCRARIYLHAHVSAGRADAIAAYGAEIAWVEGTYDDAVARAADDAERHGWHVVSDTAYPGYTDVPRQVMAGYTLLAAEAADQLGASTPTHVFVPGGVGGVAASVFHQLARSYPPSARPTSVVVEPARAPCLFASARAGRLQATPVVEETIMAGLSCGEPSHLAWPLLDALADRFATVPDGAVGPAMRLLAEAPFGDPPIVAGESAVAGLIALGAAAQDARQREELGLDRSSRVLLIGTEGATDPVAYETLTGRAP